MARLNSPSDSGSRRCWARTIPSRFSARKSSGAVAKRCIQFALGSFQIAGRKRLSCIFDEGKTFSEGLTSLWANPAATAIRTKLVHAASFGNRNLIKARVRPMRSHIKEGKSAEKAFIRTLTCARRRRNLIERNFVSLQARRVGHRRVKARTSAPWVLEKGRRPRIFSPHFPPDIPRCVRSLDRRSEMLSRYNRFCRLCHANRKRTCRRITARRMFQFGRGRPSFQYWFSIGPKHAKPLAGSLRIAPNHKQQIRGQGRRFRPAGRVNLGQDMLLCVPSLLYNPPAILSHT